MFIITIIIEKRSNSCFRASLAVARRRPLSPVWPSSRRIHACYPVGEDLLIFASLASTKKTFFLLKTNGPWPHSPWFFTSTPYWSNWTSNQFWKGLTSHICLNNVFDNDSSNSDDAYDNVYHHQGHLSDTKVATARAFAWPLLEDGNLNKYFLSEARRVGLNLNLLNLVRISRLKRHYPNSKWARWGTYFLADQITLFNGT